MAFAVTVLKIREGESEGAVYAWVGSTSVISKSLGDFRLMRVAIRCKDGQKGVMLKGELTKSYCEN